MSRDYLFVCRWHTQKNREGPAHIVLPVKPQWIIVDLGVLMTMGFLLGVVLGPFFHLVIGHPAAVDAAIGDGGFRFAARSTSSAYLAGTILGGLAWFSVRRHHDLQRGVGSHDARIRPWLLYGGTLTATAALLPFLLIQGIFEMLVPASMG